jgi:nucleoid DNA-binding protein
MLKGIVEQLAQDQNVPKKQAQELLTGMVERVTSHLKQGDRIRISGLGTLEVRKREARIGRNPATGETLQIAKQEGRLPPREGTERGHLSRRVCGPLSKLQSAVG